MSINLTLLGQAIAFAIFVGFCMKYVWPPIVAALQERQQRIDDGLAAGEQGRQELEAANAESERLLQQSRADASARIQEAEKRAARILEEAREEARAEKERIVQSAQEDIEQAQLQARNELRQQLSALVVAGVAQVAKLQVDASQHRQMLDELSAKL